MAEARDDLHRSVGSRGAERIFREEFLETDIGEETVRLDDLVERYPEFEDALRLLHSIHTGWKDVGGRDLAPGDVVGHYEILRVLGQGGFGRVYLAQQREPLRRQVALKVLRLGLDTREFLTRFEIECQALAVMNHPGIARLYETGVAAGNRPFFAMEYVEGRLLNEYCDEERLRPRERLELFRQVCSAVQHAHQNGVIHRDLKPSNILVARGEGNRPSAKVIDFGLAKPLHDSQLTLVSVTVDPNQLMGTWEYMAPEQADASVGRITTRTDIYALGTILYQILGGLLPLPSEKIRSRLEEGGIAKVIELIRDEEPLRPSQALARLSREQALRIAEARRTTPQELTRALRDELDWVVMRALEKKPQERFASVSELEADVSRYLTGQPLLTRPPSLGYLARKHIRRNRVKWALAAGAVILVVASLAIWQYGEGLRKKEASRTLLEEARSELLRHAAEEGALEELEPRWREMVDPSREDLWLPAWRREDELALWRRLSETKDRVHLHYSRAIASAQRAWEMAPSGSMEAEACRDFLTRVYWEQYQESLRGGPILLGAGYFQNILKATSGRKYVGRIEGLHDVSLASHPPGAEVYCFRYEEVDGRLLPRPYDLSRGKSIGERYLEVEAVRSEIVRDAAEEEALRVGDRLVSVRGHRTRTLGELAEALRDIGEEEAVKAKVLRVGEERTISFRAFLEGAAWPSELVAGRLDSPYHQLGVTFAGYPLDFRAENLLAVTRDQEPLAITLPQEGSYLLLLRKAGYLDARVPLVVPNPEGAECRHVVRLVRAEDVPPGFVYVPGGIVATGGDTVAFQGLEWDEHEVEGFLMGRHEVTADEWLEFVNDVRDRVDEKGRLVPSLTEIVEAFEKRGLEKLDAVPYDSGEKRLWWVRAEDGTWTRTEDYDSADFPALSVSQFAAREFAHWKTVQAARQSASGRGKPWKYRLPTDLEWERAARGVDRRVFPWGDYMIWSYCSSLKGLGGGRPERVGGHPDDESVFGVRDMAGSCLEHTSDASIPGRPYTAYRGGSWNTEDEYYFHVATRNGLLPWKYYQDSGFRLVAELTAGTEGGD